MAYDFNTAGEQRSFDVIPDRTIAVVQLNIRPSDAGEDGLLKRSKTGGGGGERGGRGEEGRRGILSECGIWRRGIKSEEEGRRRRGSTPTSMAFGFSPRSAWNPPRLTIVPRTFSRRSSHQIERSGIRSPRSSGRRPPPSRSPQT